MEWKREKRMYDEQTDYKPDYEDAKLEWMLCGALPRGESKSLFTPFLFQFFFFFFFFFKYLPSPLPGKRFFIIRK